MTTRGIPPHNAVPLKYDSKNNQPELLQHTATLAGVEGEIDLEP